MRPTFLAMFFLCLLANTNALRAADQTLSIDLGGGQSIDLVLVKHGSFQQGSPTSEASRGDDEDQFNVSLTKDFFISKTPITVGQFRRFVAETKYKTEAESGKSGGFGLVGDKLEQRPEFNWKNPGYPVTDQHPVTIVTVKDVIAFSEWLSKKAGRTIQLPSESQWEFACRGGTQTRFYSGDAESDLDGIAWYKKNTKTPMPVAQKKPNALGLFDMSGNVFQWCGDIYAPYPKKEVKDPKNRNAPEGEKARVVLRGGSFMRDSNRCRSAARYRADEGTRNAENGFRVASIVTEPASEVAKLLENSKKAAGSKANEPASISPNAGSATAGSPKANTAPASTTPAQGNSSPANSSPANSSPANSSPAAESSSTPAGTTQSSSSHANTSAADHGNSHAVESRSDSSRSIGFGVLCVGFFLLFGVVAVLIVVLVTMKPRQPTDEPPRAMGGFAFAQPSGPIRTSADGFWLHTASYVTGSIVFYHYFTSGHRHDGSVVVNSGGQQFVYTGNSPANVAIDRVEEPDANTNTPYDNTQQDNWNQYQQGYSQQSKSSSNPNHSSGTSAASNVEPSPDRELLRENNSSSFPPAY